MVFAISFTFFTSIPVFAENQEITLEEYSVQLSNLAQAYGISSLGGTDSETDLTKITLNRLIVKTDDNELLEDRGAIAKIEGYDGLHIMQYASKKAAEQAYVFYENLSNVDFV